MSALLVLIIAIVFTLSLFDRSSDPAGSGEAPGVVVPTNLIGMPVGQAEARLRTAGFTAPVQRTARTDDQAADTVIDVGPPGGTRVPRTWTITLIVSAGLRQIRIPNIIGHPEATARADLEKLGLKVVVGTHTGPAVHGPGIVEKVDPREGESVSAGSSVTIVVVVGSGADASSLTVPDVVGQTAQQAEGTLRAHGFTNLEWRNTASPRAEGIVVATEPAGGMTVADDTLLKITVSTGPGHTTIPDVIGESADKARDILDDLDVTVEENVGRSDVGPGMVEKIEPAVGTPVPAGSPVRITVASVQVDVPNVVGQQRLDAVETLRGFGLRHIEKEQVSGQPAGTVLAQNPADGIVGRGTSVALVIARAATGN